MDISTPAALVIIAILVLVTYSWHEYKRTQPDKAAMLEAIYERAVRIAQDLKKSGHFGELEDRGRRAMDTAIVYVIEQAHRQGLEINRDEVENLVRNMYQKLYGDK